MLPSWLRQLFKKRFVGQSATSPIRTSLNVETLEDRAVPAVRVWNGGVILNANGALGTNSVNARWSFGGNWQGGIAPQTGDDVVFPDGLSNTARPPSTGQGPTFQWQANSVVDQNFQINNLTVAGDNFHIDAFFG